MKAKQDEEFRKLQAKAQSRDSVIFNLENMPKEVPAAVTPAAASQNKENAE